MGKQQDKKQTLHGQKHTQAYAGDSRASAWINHLWLSVTDAGAGAGASLSGDKGQPMSGAALEQQPQQA